jgi:hypothetical protein
MAERDETDREKEVWMVWMQFECVSKGSCARCSVPSVVIEEVGTCKRRTLVEGD